MTPSIASFPSHTSRSASLTQCPGCKSLPDLIFKTDPSRLAWLETTGNTLFPDASFHKPDGGLRWSLQRCLHLQLVIIIRAHSEQLIQVLFLTLNWSLHIRLRTHFYQTDLCECPLSDLIDEMIGECPQRQPWCAYLWCELNAGETFHANSPKIQNLSQFMSYSW